MPLAAAARRRTLDVGMRHLNVCSTTRGMFRVRIVYDSQIFWRQRYGGISRYFAEIADRISQYPGADVNVFAPIHFNEYLRSARAELVTGRAMELRPPLFQFRGLLNEAASWGAFRFRHPDIVHETYYASRRVAPRSTLVVLTVYDMIHELRPQDFAPDDPTAAAKRRAAQRADHVICISENTRQDLLRFVDVDPANVSVIHLGHSLRLMRQQKADGESHMGSAVPASGAPYILFVGDRRGYKNFTSLLDAYAGSSTFRRELRLVAFGGGDFTAAEAAQLRKRGLTSAQVVHEQGDDNALGACYAHASVLVYPSLYEGFGIPVLEAMAYGCPVVAANTSSLPEVAGDAAELFDPQASGDLARAIERVAFDDARREDLRALGARRVGVFSWDRCAAETHALYRRLLAR